MYYSSAFVFVLVIVINLSGKVTLQSLPDRNYGKPPNKPRDEKINIGNGYYKKNFVVLEDNQNIAGSDQRGGSQYEGLGYRFGTGSTYGENQPNPRPQPDQYYHNQVNNNQNPQSSNSGRTQTQGSPSYAKNNGGTSFGASQGTGLVNVAGTENYNQIDRYNSPIKPVAPINGGGTTIETEASAHNARNNGGTSFGSPDGAGVFHVGYGKDNDNQIFVNSRPDQRTASVNSGRRTTQTQSGKASNNGGYGSKAYMNKVYVNGQPIQPDRNDGTWSTYYTNGQTIHVLNTGRAQPENKLRTLNDILAQIWQIKSQLKQEAERLNIKL